VTDCLFCKIAEGEIPATIVHQDADTVAFRDIQPQAPVHVLVIPRRHLSGIGSASQEDADLLSSVMLAAKRVADMEGIDGSGYRCVLNEGADASQSVPHLHVHVIGGRKMAWPPG
jgi:histidine triad (HIT) family protein